jgi:hypothetical protein
MQGKYTIASTNGKLTVARLICGGTSKKQDITPSNVWQSHLFI